MSKKGQLTIFMILGMVLLLIFAVVFYVQSIETKAYIEKTGENELIEDSPAAFLTYLDNCVGDKLEQTADKMLKQGGYLYPSVKHINNGKDFLSYGVTDNTFPPFRVPKNNKFPQGLLTEKLDEGMTGLFISNTESPYFGRETLPALCDRFGRNTLNLNDTFSCLPELYGTNNVTFQRVLEQELALQIQQCFSNELLNQRFDFTTSGNTSVGVSLGEGEAIVELYRKIEFADNSKTLSDIYFTYPLRIKKLFNAGYLLANEEIHNIFYDKEHNFTSVCTHCFDKINVTVIRDFTENDDLVILKDKASRINSVYESSLLNGSSLQGISDTPEDFDGNDRFLTMAFLVENRRPYLDPMFNLEAYADDYSGFTYPFSRGFELSVFFMDPDEDEITNITQVYRAEKAAGGSYISPLTFDYLESLPHNAPVELGCRVSGSVNLCNFQGGDDDRVYNYESVRYFFNLSISDGPKEDFQEFTLSVRHR